MKRLADDSTVVRFNVSGTRCSVLLSTLRRSSLAFPDSVFSLLFEGDAWQQQCDSEGCYFIDRDSETFRAVLQVLRYPHLAQQIERPLSRDLWHCELESWGLVQPELKRLKSHVDQVPLNALARDIRKRLLKRERLLVQYLMEKTGFSTLEYAVKRCNTLLVPIGNSPISLPDDTRLDLGLYLTETGRKATKRTLLDVLAPCIVDIDKTGSEVMQYVYDSVDYSTETQATVKVVIELLDEGDEKRQ